MRTDYKTMHSNSLSDGFSLIEINIVLLVIGIGLLALLSLFPVGLRQASLAQADTAQALFAEQVLSAIHAQATTITNWNDWKNFKSQAVDGVNIGGEILKSGTEMTIQRYLGSDNPMRYRIDVYQVKTPLDFKEALWRVAIRVIDRPVGDIMTVPVYCSDFVFMGAPPQ